jgi:7-cyano-7-deazaguanine synthase in queuosine biosynthesis
MENEALCRELFARLAEQLELDLAEKSCQELQEYLKDCEPCVEFVESLEKTMELCRKYSTSMDVPPMTLEQKETLRAAYQKHRS